ncbi:MAG: cation-transporting P-type ATPase [Candidatus Dormiibacterota bacterium]
MVSKSEAQDDLRSLPLSEVEKRLGFSPDGLTRVEAQKRLTQYGRRFQAVSATTL